MPTRSSSPPGPRAPLGQVDVRGPRFAAWLTTVVLAVVLLTGNWLLLAAQALVFAVGAALGPRRSPYGLLYAAVLAPRLRPPTEREPVAPLRFAQGVGFVFATIGVLGYVLGAPLVGALATAAALIAALLNAAFGFCLGCQLYPLLNLIRTNTMPARNPS